MNNIRQSASLPIKLDHFQYFNGVIKMYAGARAIGFATKEKQNQTFEGKFDGMPRFEIDDSASKLLDAGVKKLAKGETTDLSEILFHPELYSSYPCLKKLPVVPTNDSSNSASYSRRNGEITIFCGETSDLNGKKINELRDNIIHEIQHSVQHIEGFDQGSNANLLLHFSSTAKRKELGLRGEKLDPKIQEMLELKAIKDYEATNGEIEARDVTARINFTKKERSETPPYSSEKYEAHEGRKPIELVDGAEEKFNATKLRTSQIASQTTRMFSNLFGIKNETPEKSKSLKIS